MPTGKPEKYKQCKICGSMFIPETPAQRFCKNQHYKNCPICNKPMVWNTTRIPEPCSKECRKEKTRRFYQEKYGVDHPMKNPEVKQHFYDAMKEKYGVEHALQSKECKNRAIETNQKKFGSDWALGNKKFHERCKHTMLDKYGVEYPANIQDYREKTKITSLKKYGVDHPTKAKEVRGRIKQSMLDKYGVEYPSQSKEIQDKMRAKRLSHMDEIVENIRKSFMQNYGVPNCFQSDVIKEKIVNACIDKYGFPSAMQNEKVKEKVSQTIRERYGVNWFVQSEQFLNAHAYISKTAQNFANKLISRDIAVSYEFPLQSYRYDIKLNNTLVEIDPTYTHSILENHWGPGLDKNYHKNKTDVANQANFKCVHVFSWDCEGKVINIIDPNKTEVDDNELQIYMLNKAAATKFLNNYSIQGSYNKDSYYIGLVKDGIIYQMIALSKSRYNPEYYAEITRWQTNPNFRITNGYAKLLNFVQSDNFLDVKNAVLYYDKAKQFEDDITLNMNYVHDNPPIMIWSNQGNKFITDRIFRRYGYKGITNELDMIKEGWRPVYNCGYGVYQI